MNNKENILTTVSTCQRYVTILANSVVSKGKRSLTGARIAPLRVAG